MNRRSRTGAEVLAEGLATAGVQHVFGLPGDTGVEFYDALYDARSSLRHIMCRDERHAAIMADVYARCTNRVGVVEVSSGGGATYCVGGLGESFAASTPILVISSDVHARSRNTGALTELDQQRLYGAVTKWCQRAESADELPILLGEALRAATSGRPAPVALIVPENVLGERTSVPFPEGVGARSPMNRPAPDPAAVDAIVEGLRRAERPAIVAGGGVHLSDAYEALAELAERAAVPVATTIHGKGAYSERGPWALGVVGANGARPYANAYLEVADFVLFVGTRANATDTNGFQGPGRSTRVAQIDIDAERAGRNYPGCIRVVADARAALSALSNAVGDPGFDRAGLRRQLEQDRSAWEAWKPAEVGFPGLHPWTAMAIVRESADPGALVVSDCGTPTPFLAAHWTAATPGRHFVVARGHGPMGYAIPGAIGAALASPGRRVVAFTTDGSFGMACGELETAVRLRLPITFVQLTNGSFGWIKMLQHLYHAGRYFSVDLGPVDACGVARAFGLNATKVHDADELKGAVCAAENAQGPTYIEIQVPEMDVALPPVAPWTAALTGESPERPVY